MNIENMKIGTRLSLGFGVVLMLMVAIIAVGMTNMAAMDNRMNDIVNDNNYKTKLINTMLESTHIVARVVRSIVLLEDKAAMDTEMKKIDAARKAYGEAWEALNKTEASEKGKEFRAKIQEARSVTVPLNDQVLALGFANKAAEAIQLLMKQAGPAGQKWLDALDANAEFQEANTKKDFETSQQAYSNARTLMIALGAVALLLGVAIGWLLTRSITRQLGAEPGDAAALAQGVAEGDLSARIDIRPGDSTSMMAQLKTMQDSLAQVVNNVRQNAEGVATASAQIAQGNIDLSSRTEEQASALEQTAASMEELSSTVKQNADNARQGNQLAQSASSVAIKGGEVVGQVVETMKGINDASKKIADIIGVIDGIAFQTNILALNAAVEAARAGEQGRGFAVVASEVRSLAGRSADAAKEIKALISTSVERVAQGTALVDQAGVTMNEVVSSIKRVTDIMGEISAASTEQSSGVAQIGEAVTQMDQATQQNAALVEESAAAAESLKGQAQQLVSAVAIFKLGHGAETRQHAAAPMAHTPATPKSFPAADRRGPSRAQNVKRLAPKATSDATVLTAKAETRKTGTDDEWTSF